MDDSEFEVVVYQDAIDDLMLSYTFVQKNAPNTVANWLERLQIHVKTLSRNPQRCPIARESKRVFLEVRELHFGRRPNVFRILFTIDQKTVRVLKIVRAQRRWRSIEGSFWNE